MIWRLPKCILFDLDGTLIDSLPGIESSVRAAFAACALPLLCDNFRETIGPPIRTILSRVGGLVDEKSLNALELKFREDYDSRGWQKTVCFSDASKVLRHLSEQGHRLFVVSNKPRHISLSIMKKESVCEYFESIVTRDSRSPGYTDKEEMIRALLSERQIRSMDCLMVGDTMEDANAAARTDIRFAFMTYGYGDAVEVPSMPIAWKLDSLARFLEHGGDSL